MLGQNLVYYKNKAMPYYRDTVNVNVSYINVPEQYPKISFRKFLTILFVFDLFLTVIIIFTIEFAEKNNILPEIKKALKK